VYLFYCVFILYASTYIYIYTCLYVCACVIYFLFRLHIYSRTQTTASGINELAFSRACELSYFHTNNKCAPQINMHIARSSVPKGGEIRKNGDNTELDVKSPKTERINTAPSVFTRNSNAK